MKETLILSNRLFMLKCEGIQDGIKQSNQVAEIMARHLSKRLFHLNVIEAACHGRFKETGHSLVLADMLRFPSIQASFLDTFLGITHDDLNVTAERDRVDVALRGKNVFVIIENKVNAAGEQESQVYRYVHEIGIDKYGYKMSQIYVVYLNPTNRSYPSDYSLCDENKQNNVFKDLGEDHYTILSYKHDITDWLRGMYKGFKNSEPHVYSALDQYVDFLEHKFHTSQIYKEMNKEIKELLLNELHIEDKSYEDKMEALKNQSQRVNELLNAIEDLKSELKKKHSHDLMLDWQNQVEKLLGIKVASDSHSFGVQLRNNVWLGVWDGYDEEDLNPYWGFQYNSYRKNDMPELYEDIEKLLKSAGISYFKSEQKEWIAWCSTEKGVERFLSLYNAAKNSALL